MFTCTYMFTYVYVHVHTCICYVLNLGEAASLKSNKLNTCTAKCNIVIQYISYNHKFMLLLDNCG